MTNDGRTDRLDPSVEALTDATAAACNRGYGRLLALADFIGPATVDDVAALQAWAVARQDLDSAWALETAQWARGTPSVAEPPDAWARSLRAQGATRAAAERAAANEDPEAVRDILAALREAGLATRADAPGPRLYTGVAEDVNATAYAVEGVTDETQLGWDCVFTEAAQQRLATLPETAAMCLAACATEDAARVRMRALDTGNAQIALCADTLGRWRHAEAARRRLTAQLAEDTLSAARVVRELREHAVAVVAARYANGAHPVEIFTLEVAVRHAVGIPTARPHALLAMTEPTFGAAYCAPTVRGAETLDVATLLDARLAVLTASADVLRTALMRDPGAKPVHVRPESLWALADAFAAEQPAFPRLETRPLSVPPPGEVPSLLLARVCRALAAFERDGQ